MPIKFKSYQEDVVLEKWAAVGKHLWEEESGPSLDHGVTQGLWSVLKGQYSSSKYLPAQMSEKLVQRQFCVELNFCQCQPQTSNILASPRLLCICITYLFILLHTLHTFWLISVVLWIYLSYTITLSSSLPTRCSVQAVPLSCLLSICSVISSWTKEPRQVELARPADSRQTVSTPLNLSHSYIAACSSVNHLNSALWTSQASNAKSHSVHQQQDVC